MVSHEVGRLERLGGVGEKIAAALDELTGKETRLVVLGHLLRGGSPTTFDRLIAQRFGAAAVRAIDEGQRGVMVALDPPTVRYVPARSSHLAHEDRPAGQRCHPDRPRSGHLPGRLVAR